MAKTYNLQPVLTALQSAKQTLILLPQNPSLDAVAAGLSLYLSLTKANLATTIGCASPMTVNFNRLYGVDKIKPRIGNQNLVISFSYPEDSLEKVSYDKDPQNQKFHLTIEPKAGFEPLDVNQVEYSYTGSNADVIFVIGASRLEDLGSLYQQEKKLLDDKQKTLINLSTTAENSQFGTVNLYDPTASGCAEIVSQILPELNLPLSQDIATNLLAGVEASTNNLQTANQADTYEVIASLLRAGAKKGQLTPPGRSGFPGFRPLGTAPAGQTPFRGFMSTPSKPAVSPRPNQPTGNWPVAPTPAPSRPVSPAAPSQETPQQTSGASPDWLKPKVFKSTDVSD